MLAKINTCKIAASHKNLHTFNNDYILPILGKTVNKNRELSQLYVLSCFNHCYFNCNLQRYFAFVLFYVEFVFMSAINMLPVRLIGFKLLVSKDKCPGSIVTALSSVLASVSTLVV